MDRDVFNTWLVAILSAVLTGIAIASWVVVRRRGRFLVERRNLPAATSPDQLIGSSIAKVVREFSDRAVTVQTKVFRNRSDDFLEVLFLVDNETERKPNFASLCEEFDEAFRRELLLSGYFCNRKETVWVTTMSIRGYDEYIKSHPLE